MLESEKQKTVRKRRTVRVGVSRTKTVK